MSTFIFGHKNPDTDSVCSSIAYAYYKQELGEMLDPRVLGDLRKEASFVLNYFNITPPKFLEDVKVQAKDLNFDRIIPLTVSSSVYEAYMNMDREKIHTLPIVDDIGKLLGIVSMKDIASALINIHDNIVNTTLASFINVFSNYSPKMIMQGKSIDKVEGLLKVFNPHIPQDSVIEQDNVIILKHYHKKEFFQKLNLGVNMIILPQYDELDEEELNLLKKYDITTISLDLSSPMIIKKMHQTDSIASIMKKDKIQHFTMEDYLIDIKESMLKTNFRNYPLVDADGYYMGMLGRKHLLKPGRKKVILVDHNEFSQSATGIEEANILEIVDHHKIGGITTNEPIVFINMTVGSTCTIVYELFKNSNIKIPRHIAGCLISGILSDTMYFKSPTCTKKDIEAVQAINDILNLDLDDYTQKMFKAGSSIEGMTLKELLYNDFKEFNLKGRKIAISQLFTMDIEELEEKKEELLKYMKDIYEQNNYNILLLAVTDMVKEGSYMYYISDDKSIIRQSFDLDESQGAFSPMTVSRKKQIVPMITNTLELI